MARIRAIAVLTLITACQAWSFTGHELIAELASTLLTERATDRVDDILGDRSLSSIAPWADSYDRLLAELVATFER